MVQATASHILVKTAAQCEELKQQILAGAEFGALLSVMRRRLENKQ